MALPVATVRALLPDLQGLWRNGDFLRLWAGETVSIFGTLIGRLALTFTAILWLDASPLEIAALGICEMAPGVGFGLVAGVWVDRLPRRMVLIWADLGRAMLLVTVPAAAVLGGLTIWQVFAVALGRAVLDSLFETAYQAYLPGLVGAENVIEGNSKLAATSSAAEVGGFGMAGWLVQLFTAPGAVLVDALSFALSALAIWRIRSAERPDGVDRQTGFAQAAVEGLRHVWNTPLLRSLLVGVLLFRLPMGIFSAVFVVFVTRELDIGPGLQGSIYAIGGLTSFAGAMLAARSARWHLGRSLAVASAVRSVGSLLPGLAAGPPAARIGILTAQQFVTDPAWTYYEIQETSIRQAAVPDRVLGRVVASFRAAEFGAALLGLGLGGVIAETAGLRAAMIAAGSLALFSVAPMLSIHVRRLQSLPAPVARRRDC